MNKIFLYLIFALNVQINCNADSYKDSKEYYENIDSKNRYCNIKELSFFEIIKGPEGSYWSKFEEKMQHFFYFGKLIDAINFLKQNKDQANKECRNLLMEIYRNYKDKNFDYFSVCANIMRLFKANKIESIDMEKIAKLENRFKKMFNP